MTRVAIQGYRGCFHEQAAREFYPSGGAGIGIVECPTFTSLFEAVKQGRADALVIAIENTISGGLVPNFELLREYPFKIKGEVYIPIHQNLMAVPGQRLEDIREVRTHYMAINQTRPFFEKNCPWIKLSESEDTAKSAAQLSASGEKGVGAVASELAAALSQEKTVEDAVAQMYPRERGSLHEEWRNNPLKQSWIEEVLKDVPYYRANGLVRD
jgi:prephenate dehydratase